MPQLSYSHVIPANVTSETYDFSAVPAGTFPSNSSFFGFSTIGPSVTSTFEGAGSPEGNGFLVSTYNLSTAGFLRIAVSPVQQNFTMNMSFFWNDSSNYAFTEDSIAVFSGANEIFNISFGPQGSYFVRENGVSGKQVATDPPMNELCNLTISYDDASGTYFAFSNGTGEIFPIYYDSALVNTSDITVLVGGYVSTLFLRAISIYDSNFVACAQRASTPIDFTSSVLQNFPGELQSLKGVEYDRFLNTIVGVTDNGSLLAYNLVNSTSFFLRNGDRSNDSYLVSSSNTSNSMYFIAEDSNFTKIYVVNSTALTTRSVVLDFGGYTPIAISTFNQSAIIFNSNGTLSDVYGNLSEFQNINLQLDPGARILSAETHGNSVNATWLSGGNLTSFRIFPDNASYVGIQTLAVSDKVGEIYVLDTESHCGNVTSMIQYGLNSTISTFSQSGMESLPLNTEMEVTSSIFAAGDSIVDYNSSYLAVDGSLLQPIQGVTSDSQTLLDAGGTVMLSIYNGSAILSLPTGENTTSGTGIQVTVPTTYTMTGSGKFVTNVSSKSQYVETISFGNVSTKTSNGTFYISADSVEDGQYAALVSADNVQGFTTSASCEIIIDHGAPAIAVNVENGSYLSQSPLMKLNYTFWTQISEIYAIVGTSNTTLPARNFTVELNLSGMSGVNTLQLFLVDQFGISHSYNFTITIVPEQSGPYWISIANGTYFDSNSIGFSWSLLNYSSLYYLNFSGSENLSLSGIETTCNITLNDGSYYLNVSAILKDGMTVKIAERHFVIQAFGPGLILSGNCSGYYSFTGNSLNNTFSVTAESNVSATVNVSLISPSGDLIYQATGEDSISFNASSHLDLLNSSGVYTVIINATGNSGLSSSAHFELNVNNSLPSIPFSDTSVYTNQSEVSESPDITMHCNYSIDLFKSSTLISRNINSSILILSSGTGNYTAEITVVSAWGNWVTENLSIMYETAPPVIVLNTSYNGSEYLSYQITDSAPILSMNVMYQGKSVSFAEPNKQGSIKLVLPRNSIYNVSVKVADFCGNIAYSNLTLNFQKLVNITGYSITVYPLLGLGIVILHLRGQNTGNATVNWTLQGKSYNGTFLILPFMGFGTHSFTAVIHYGNASISVSKEAFFLGWYPIVLAGIAVLSLIAVRRMRQSSDPEEIRDLIATMSGAPVKEILRSARKAGLSPKTVESAISELKKTGEVKLESDPDGVLYLFSGKKK